QDTPPAHPAEGRPALVPELHLDLVEVLREVAVGADFTPHEIRHDLLVGRPEAEVAVVAVLQAKELAPVLLPAAALLPQLGRDDGRHEDLLRAGPVHLLAHDRLEPTDGTEPEWEEIVDAARHLADHAGTEHEPVAHDLRVRGILAQSRDEQPGEPGHVPGCSSRHW